MSSHTIVILIIRILCSVCCCKGSQKEKPHIPRRFHSGKRAWADWKDATYQISGWTIGSPGCPQSLGSWLIKAKALQVDQVSWQYLLLGVFPVSLGLMIYSEPPVLWCSQSSSPHISGACTVILVISNHVLLHQMTLEVWRVQRFNLNSDEDKPSNVHLFQMKCLWGDSDDEEAHQLGLDSSLYALWYWIDVELPTPNGPVLGCLDFGFQFVSSLMIFTSQLKSEVWEINPQSHSCVG